MLLGERINVLLFSEPVSALADVGQRADVVIGKFAVQHEAAQGISLPGRAVLGPLKQFLENGHLRITGSNTSPIAGLAAFAAHDAEGQNPRVIRSPTAQQPPA